MTVKAVWHIVKESARSIGVSKLAPHDLRRSFARLAQSGGAPVEQIQYSLGHASFTTTEVYLGLRQDLIHAPGDCIQLKLPPEEVA